MTNRNRRQAALEIVQKFGQNFIFGHFTAQKLGMTPDTVDILQIVNGNDAIAGAIHFRKDLTDDVQVGLIQGGPKLEQKLGQIYGATVVLIKSAICHV